TAVHASTMVCPKSQASAPSPINSDAGTEINLRADGFDHTVTASELIGDGSEAWLFGHTIVEACTAVKGAACQHIFDDPTCDALFYFDPDIAVFNPMDDIVNRLNTADIVLTPHQIVPEARTARQAILDNEITSLSHGAYNLGFLALANRGEGARFATWWDERLRDWCHDRKDIGVFVDQKWCDLVPCFFDNVHIHRDPGCNVASWNLSHRTLTIAENGELRVNGVPLKFYHFTKLGPIGDTMTQRYARENTEVYELWAWYRNAVADATEPGIPNGYWHYRAFDNGTDIPDAARRLYRERQDLRAAFPHPYQVENGFLAWLASETDFLKSA
ncbi:MAG: hypothetical protein AAFY31_00765, partial [Pseudomonadota bacterium]